MTIRHWQREYSHCHVGLQIELHLHGREDRRQRPAPLDMSNLTYDASALQFDLTMDALVTEPYPSGTFSPAYFPGLFY